MWRDSSTLNMEAEDSSRMLVTIYQITLCHVPEHSNLYILGVYKN
jgi:hypothetical protein